MWRVLWFLGLAAAAAAVMAWLLDRPGSVHLEWQGYRIETSVALLATVMVIVAIATAITYRLFLALKRTPTQLG